MPPQRLRPDVPRDLDTICLKCLEKDPSKRYGDALALADDLRRYLDEPAPIAARPVGPVGRCWRWTRRNPWVAGLASAVFVLLVGGTIVSTTLAIRATRAEAATRDQRDRAERARDRAFEAINAIVLTNGDRMRSAVLTEGGRTRGIVLTDDDRAHSEELRAYREPLIDEGLRLANEIVAEPEGDPRAETTRASALMARAKLLQEKGDRGEARQVGMKAIEAMRGLVARYPTSTEYRAGLASALHHASQFSDDPEASRADAMESNRIYEALLRESSRSERTIEWTRQVILSLRHIGHMYYEQKWELRSPERVELLRRAVEAFLAGKALCERQIDAVAPERRDGFVFTLAANEIYLCRAHRSMAVQYANVTERRAQIRKAVEYGNQAISHFQAIVARNPDNYQYGWDLHIAHRELGDLCIDPEQGNDLIAAIPYYNRSRETLKAMAVRQSKLVSRVAAIQTALAILDYNMQLAFNADLPRLFAGPRRAIISEIHEICDKLSLVQPLSADLLKIHAHTCLEMADYQSLDGERPDIALCLRAEQLWDRLYREDPRGVERPGMLVIARRNLADAFEERGQAADASRWRSRSLESARGNAELFYILAANAYAFSVTTFAQIPSTLGRDQLEKQRRHNIAEGVEMIRQAVASGFRDVDRLRNDPQLAPLRGSPEFQTLILDLQFPADAFARLDRGSGTLLPPAGPRQSGPAR